MLQKHSLSISLVLDLGWECRKEEQAAAMTGATPYDAKWDFSDLGTPPLFRRF